MTSENNNGTTPPERSKSTIISVERSGELSMTSLIIWNVNKALKNDPNLNLRSALSDTRVRLETSAHDVKSSISQHSANRHLVCALLAWQQLGHQRTASLYSFLESTLEKTSNQENISKCSYCGDKNDAKTPPPQIRDYISFRESNYSSSLKSSSYTLNRMGPVVKLPVHEKVVMHLQNSCSRSKGYTCGPSSKTNTKQIMERIDAACCIEKACHEKLAQVEKSTKEMRERAQRLAKREAERVELLERAEAAWRELERGYQRRLKRAVDQADELLKQIQKHVEERKGYRNACVCLGEQLKCRGGHAEEDRARLAQIEQQVCEHACARHRLREEAARADSIMADYQCKIAQLDRDLQYKEEQVRCKKMTQSSELESLRALAYEAERIMHAELSSLKDHIAGSSAELLGLDGENKLMMEKIEEIKLKKNEMLEDLDKCQENCDENIKEKVNQLKKMRQELSDLKEKVVECRCKQPVEVAAEVRRTSSLAALCACDPEDRFSDSCSCTSLRSKLMNNLLVDLFSGLQGELGNCILDMPCQLLKCFEEKHNWDKSSAVKTNLEKFFSKLLVGELDIAITNSVEKYHAKWVGSNCVEKYRLTPEPGDVEEGWQKRVIERRAQKLATKLAEQLFQQRAEELTSKAKEIIKANPSCDCTGTNNAIYHCSVKPKTNVASVVNEKDTSVFLAAPLTQSSWRRTQQTVTHLKDQMLNLKMKTVKKQDLRKIEENVNKLLQRTSVLENDVGENAANENKDEKKTFKSDNLQPNGKQAIFNAKFSNIKKKVSENHTVKKVNRLATSTEPQIMNTKLNKPPTEYTNYLCLCSPQNKETKFTEQNKVNEKTAPLKQNSSIQQSISMKKTCANNCVCLNSVPSTTSIDNLLNTVAKWKNELKSSSAANHHVEPDLVVKDIIRKNSVTFSGVVNTETIPKSCHVTTCKINSKESLAKLTNMDKEGFLSVPKDSEYLATVNLEKSMEMLCKCIPIDTENNRNNNSGFLKKNSNGSQSNLIANRPQSNRKISNVMGDISNIIKGTSRTSIQDEYNIKFLGATVTNDKESKSSLSNDGNASNNICNCQGKNALIKNLTENDVSEQKQFRGKTSFMPVKNTSNKIILPITQSYNVHVNSEPTKYKVCASSEIFNEDDYQNLEDNAFELLREHLTEKMGEYSKVFQYSRIPKEEEQKLCSNILQKVKQVISDSTSTKPFCQCPNLTQESHGTWDRAYKLLQEYLKTKLKRAQCICITEHPRDCNKNTLPVILQNITDMIEKDFRKLSEMYILKNNVHLKDTESQALFELPERDTNNTFSPLVLKKDETTSQILNETVSVCCAFKPETISKQISGNFIPYTENMASQVPFQVNMENKGCAISCEKVNKNIQYEDISQDEHNQCRCDLKNEHKEEIEVTQNSVESSEMPPYVGLTVECSCVGKLESCVCSKALSSEYDKIKHIWKDIANCKSNDVSYILNKTLHHVNSDSNLVLEKLSKETVGNIFKADANSFRDIEITTSNEDDFVLKKSLNSETMSLVKDVYNDVPQFGTIDAPSKFEKFIKHGQASDVNSKSCIKRCKSELFSKSKSEQLLTIGNTFGRECDCSMVPICHVKMLMESIENRLVHLKCTCDSLSPHVCPIHSYLYN